MRKVANIAKLAAFMVSDLSFPLMFVKIFNFDDLDTNSVLFLRILLEEILINTPINAIETIFIKVGKNEN